MTTVTSKVFRSGNSEAIRMPKEVAFGADIEVTITRQGDVVTISPLRPSLKEMVRRLRELPKPAEVQKRDRIVFPKRPGL
ncbi:antitoxin [Phenylobacterium sp.]|uniref:antitoxin n=1 Tax=Phenylobacterium sp. TaxID=1871053 RepID=UPI0025E17063|nr:AbrB/MazE/SpoVT family DNA-binding domain-containing protein [Phenylobacterium sp.]MBX3484822.1 AbrB/MazE/SpoVT family DNA-binding domain-containing protein [Phenylobacterium sp.]MCW5759385.1 AbrB/MazE/SpoVT family DNA-binding domain-containing protein [Phenylobacterium sp.]